MDLNSKNTDLSEDVFHGHDKALSVVEAELVVRVTTTGVHTPHVCQEHSTVHPTEHVPDHHRLLDPQLLGLAATMNSVSIGYCKPILFVGKIIFSDSRECLCQQYFSLQSKFHICKS